MIDLHSHILADVDDGAQSLSTSQAMLDAYAHLGFTTVVATPHWGYSIDEQNQAKVFSAFLELVPEAEKRGVRLLLGRECMLPPDHKLLVEDNRLFLNQSRFILVELPFHTRPIYLEEVIFGLQAAGKIVVLAHPERYQFIQRNIQIATELADRGVLLQINIGSVKGTFGKAAKILADYLLTNSLVHIAATDAHSDRGRMQTVEPSLKILQNMMGEEGCRRLVQINPGLILADLVPEPVRPQVSPPTIFARLLSRFHS